MSSIISASHISASVPATGNLNATYKNINHKTRDVQLNSYSSSMQSTKGEFAGASITSLRKYLDIGGGNGDTRLSMINVQRKSLSKRIDNALKTAGIELGKDDKISISVDGDNKIVVSGIKDSKKAKAAEAALNSNVTLGKSLRKYAALGQMNMDTARLAADKNDTISGDAYTNRTLRTFVVDQYLQDNYGVALDEIAVESLDDGNVRLVSENEGLAAAVDQDSELGATITNILENNENVTGFSATFNFANGSLSDPGSKEAIKNKLDGIQEVLMGKEKRDSDTGQIVGGLATDLHNRLTAMGYEGDGQLLQALSRGFSISVKATGEISLVGLDDMADKDKETLINLVQKALDCWAKDGDYQDIYGIGKVASFADVAEALIEEHQYEHGDTQEHEHELEINLAGGASAYNVVSPAADEQQHMENTMAAKELGDALRGVLSANGVQADGLEMTIDQSGRIKVSGADRTQVQQAQIILDEWTKTVSQTGKDEQKTEKAEQTASDKDEKTADSDEDSVDARLSETGAPISLATFQRKPLPQAQFGADMTVAGRKMSRTVASWAGRIDENTGMAEELYLSLMQGMQFHDGRRNVTYALQ